MAWLRGVLALAAVMAAGAGCSGESLGGNMPMPSGTGGAGVGAGAGGTGNVGTMLTGSGGIAGTNGDGTGGTIICGFGSTTSVATPVSPDILVVFDRSATMADDSNEMSCTGGCGGTSKWSLLTVAIENVITANPQVNWGLSLYGGDQSCTAGVAVPVGAGTEMPIWGALAAAQPAGDAPTVVAIDNAAVYFEALADDRPRYIMLVTDGLSGCSSAGGEDGASVANVISAALVRGWSTFVVGLAPAADTAAISNLNLWAQAGGEPKGSGNAFYAPADLSSVLAPVSDATACTIPLSPPPAAGVSLAVSVTMADGSQAQVPQDPASGWSFWDPSDTSVVLNGQWCQEVQTGQIAAVSIHYNCPVILPGG